MRCFKFLILLLITSTAHSNLLKLPWGDEKHKILTQDAKVKWSDKSSEYPTFKYPINNQEDLISQYNSGTVPIFSYGSLLNKESAARTLSPKAMKTHKPAIAFSTRRIFDRHVPKTKRWGPMERPNDTAMLNIISVDNFSEIVNGVVIDVDYDDLVNLSQREEGYDLVPVIITSWEDANSNNHAEFFVAYTFQAPYEPREGVTYTNNYINPVPGYAFASKSGAAQYGDDFLNLWIESTYLADKVTPFSLWENTPEIDCIFESGCQKPKKTEID